MPPTITGARGTGNVQAGIKKQDVASRILQLQPEAAPLTVFSKRLSSKPAVNDTVKWWEDDLDPRFDTLGAAIASTGTTSVTVTNPSYWYEHAIGYVTATGELFRVQSIAGSVLTVVRGVGSTAATASNGAELMILSSAQPQGDTSRPARSGNPTEVSNYLQIFRTPVELTETWRHSDQIVEDDDEDYQKANKGIEHLRDIEYALKFGRASRDTSGSQPRNTTAGCFSFISTNSTAVGGAMTEATFFGALRSAFRYGSKEKLLLASPLVVDVLNTYARGKVQVTDQGRTVYGVKVVDYVSPHGTVHVVTDWTLEGTAHSGSAILLDMSAIRWRYLANKKGSRDTRWYPDIQAPDADTKKGEWKTEGGLEFGLEKRHAKFSGVTG